MIGELISGYTAISQTPNGRVAEMVCIVRPKGLDMRTHEVRLATPVPDDTPIGLHSLAVRAAGLHLLGVKLARGKGKEKDQREYERFVVTVGSGSGDSPSEIEGYAWIAVQPKQSKAA